MVTPALSRFAPLLVLASCAGGLPIVPHGSHPLHVQEYIEVEFPPPPAQIEEMPEEFEPNPDCEWVDGYYHWDGKWSWRPGRWVLPPDDCYYAPPVIAWSKTQEPKLYYSPPRWYRDDAALLPRDRAMCVAPRTCTGTSSASVAP